MKKKIVVIGIIISVLLIGIVSASLLDFFGKITGSVEVKGPVFYASNEYPLGGDTYFGLGINKYTLGNPVSFIGPNPKLFVSEQLGIESFYAANYEISIEAESDNENGQIDAEIYFIEGDDPYNKKLEVCSGSTTEPVHGKGTYKITTCQTGELINIDPEWRLVLRLTDGLNDINYNIYLMGNTKIEVSAT